MCRCRYLDLRLMPAHIGQSAMNVMIIPAAGRGTRLEFDGPKLLFPLQGKPLIEYLLHRYSDLVDHFVVVVNPMDAQYVEQHLATLDYSYELALQTEPTGMLDAILAPLDNLDSERINQIWITWCDQVGIRQTTAETLHQLLLENDQDMSGPAIIFPTVKKENPYIHMQRDEQGEIKRVLQRREGDEMPEVGENDCGLFAMNRVAYFKFLPEFSRFGVEEIQAQGAATKERNFLPFIAWLFGKAKVVTFAAASASESIGINTLADAQTLIESQSS